MRDSLLNTKVVGLVFYKCNLPSLELISGYFADNLKKYFDDFLSVSAPDDGRLRSLSEPAGPHYLLSKGFSLV